MWLTEYRIQLLDMSERESRKHSLPLDLWSFQSATLHLHRGFRPYLMLVTFCAEQTVPKQLSEQKKWLVRLRKIVRLRY